MPGLEIHVVDMEAEMQLFAKNKITEAFDTLTKESKIADFLTSAFFRQFTGSWNCIVGKNFGSHVVQMTQSYLFCTYNSEISILLWKSG